MRSHSGRQKTCELVLAILNGSFGGAAVERGTGAEFYFYSLAEEDWVRRLAGPDEGLARMQAGQLFWCEIE